MGQGNKKRKPGRYANGAKISSAKAWMQTAKAKKIRDNAYKLSKEVKTPKPGPDYELGHNAHGPGKHGWEKISKNRAVETKNKNKRKLRIT